MSSLSPLPVYKDPSALLCEILSFRIPEEPLVQYRNDLHTANKVASMGTQASADVAGWMYVDLASRDDVPTHEKRFLLDSAQQTWIETTEHWLGKEGQDVHTINAAIGLAYVPFFRRLFQDHKLGTAETYHANLQALATVGEAALKLGEGIQFAKAAGEMKLGLSKLHGTMGELLVDILLQRYYGLHLPGAMLATPSLISQDRSGRDDEVGFDAWDTSVFMHNRPDPIELAYRVQVKALHDNSECTELPEYSNTSTTSLVNVLKDLRLPEDVGPTKKVSLPRILSEVVRVILMPDPPQYLIKQTDERTKLLLNKIDPPEEED